MRDDTKHDPERRIAALARIAREQEPPALEADRARAMIARALDASARDARTPRLATRPPWPALALAAAVLLAIGAALAWPDAAQAPAARVEAPSRMRLPTGDEIAATAGARFSLLESHDARRIRLDEGALAFDVRPLGPSASFEVITQDLEVRVLGTVFSVDAGPTGTSVHVYEGRVAIAHGARISTLEAGESLSVRGAQGVDPMREIASRWAAARSQASAEPVPVPPPPSRVEVASEPVPPPRAPRPREAVAAPRLEPDGARAWIAAGDSERALAAARRALAAGQDAGPWSMVEGDALRALHRPGDAVDAYERAASDPALRVRAGYLSASLRAQRLGDREGALEALERHACAAEGSPLAERALALRVSLLAELGRPDEAARAARDYLARFEDGPHAGAMRARIATP